MKARVLVVLMLTSLLALAYALSTFQASTIPPPSPQVNNNVPTEVSFPENMHIGVWMWEAPQIYEQTFLENFFSTAQADGINAVYIRIDDFIDIIELNPLGTRSDEAAAFSQNLRAFVTLASAYDLQVYAVAGNETWANPSHAYIPVLLTEYVIDYNQESTPEEKIAGMHFDIESYSQEVFQTPANQEQILEELLVLTQSLVDLIERNNADIALGITVPYWLDGTTRSLPLVTYGNENKQTVFHLIDILSTLEAADLIIMAYRNESQGANGTIELVKEEISYAASTSVRVLVAQETIEYTDDAHATFFGMKKHDLMNAALELAQAYPNTAFGGVAIHDLAGYLNLK